MPDGPRHPELLAEAASDVTFECASDGTVSWVSRGIADLLGWMPDEVVGKPFTDLVFDHDRDHVLGLQRQVIEGREVRVRLQVREAGGRGHWIDVLAKPMFAADGTVVGRFGSWRDAEQDVLAVQQREAMFASMIDPMVIFRSVRDDAGQIVDFEYVDANPAACTYNQVDRADLIGKTLLELLPAHAATRLIDDYIAVVESDEPLVLDSFAYPRELFGGERRYYDIRAVKLGDGLSYTWRDVTDRVESAQRLARSEERFRLLAENSSDVVAHLRDGVIVWMSPSVEAVTGRPPSEWIGRPAMTEFFVDDVPALEEAMDEVSRGQARILRARFTARDGTTHWGEIHGAPYRDADGQPDGIIASLRVVDDVVRAEERLARAARYDELTGLFNRREAYRVLAGLADQSPRTGTRTAVLYCDVDNLKTINDRHGHTVGDEVLKVISERIIGTIRAQDMAARLGGDEILVVLDGVHDLANACDVAQKVLAAVSEGIEVNGVVVRATLSMGVTLAEPGLSGDQLIERADAAMYRAKSAGRNQVVAAG